MTRLLVVDTETGGLDPQIHSILSLGAVVWEDGQIGDEFEVLIAEQPLTVTARALEINRIDLVEHARHAVDPSEAMSSFRSFLARSMSGELKSRDKIALVGHNVNFDVSFLRRLCRLSGAQFEGMFSHRTIDTAGLVRFLVLAGRLPLSGAGSDEAFKHFGIALPAGTRHTAVGDAKATALMLNKLIDLVR